MKDEEPRVLEDILARLKRPDRGLLALTIVAFVLWISCVGPVRDWAAAQGIRQSWVFGVAPSFFAGATLVFWQSLVTGTRVLASLAFSIALTLLAEGAQMLLPGSTADLGDIAAGIAGACVAAPLLSWRLRAAARRAG